MTTLAAQYRADGYAVVPGVLDSEAVAAALAETIEICRGTRGPITGLSPDPSCLDDEELLRRCLAVHFPHKVSPLFRTLLAPPVLVTALTEVIGPDVKCMQSMLFVKAAGKPGQAWHQDENYIPTRDRSLCGAWVALDDARVDNGALWVLPGSHRAGVIWPGRPHGAADFDEGWEAYGFPDEEAAAVPVELDAGDAVLFDGYLLHRSLPNRRATGFRRALVNHYMSAQSMLPWDWDGRLAPTRDMRDVELVAGVDPYAYKGTVDLTHALVRNEVAEEGSGLFL
jgi:phytanoyl-CoA hydroxylase